MTAETDDTDGRPAGRARALIARHGGSFAAELGLDLSGNAPSGLFRWLCASLLLSAPMPARTAMRAAAALAEAGWTGARSLAASAWEERVAVLDGAGYGRFDEKTASMLGALADRVLEAYGGDLRGLRAAAGRDPGRERALVMRFKGIGETGADIFLREVQAAWDELYPFADARALEAARRLGLPDTAESLARLVGREAFPDLLGALVRAGLAGQEGRGG